MFENYKIKCYENNTREETKTKQSKMRKIRKVIHALLNVLDEVLSGSKAFPLIFELTANFLE